MSDHISDLFLALAVTRISESLHFALDGGNTAWPDLATDAYEKSGDARRLVERWPAFEAVAEAYWKAGGLLNVLPNDDAELQARAATAAEVTRVVHAVHREMGVTPSKWEPSAGLRAHMARLESDLADDDA